MGSLEQKQGLQKTGVKIDNNIFLITNLVKELFSELLLTKLNLLYYCAI